MQSIFSDHHGMKLGINIRRKLGKFIHMFKLNNTIVTNDPQKKSQGKLENTLK